MSNSNSALTRSFLVYLLNGFRKPFFRLINIYAIILSFLLSHFNFPALASQSSIPGVSLISTKFFVPAHLGILQKTHLENNQQPLIVHIQDAHAHPEAQKNIALLLEHLNQAGKVVAVGYEGVFDQLQPEILNEISQDDFGRQVFQRLIDQGELTGGELFAWQHQNQDISYFGADDLGLYKKSYEAFKDVKFAGEKIQNLFNEIDKETAVNDRQLRSELKEFIQVKRTFQKHPSDGLKNYLTLLSQLTLSRLGKDLSDASQQFDWPNLSRFLQIIHIEGSFDSRKAQKDLEELRKILNQLEAQDLVRALDYFTQTNITSFTEWVQQEELSFLNLRHFSEKLSEEVNTQNSFELLKYPPFLKMLQVQILHEEIDVKALFQEMDKIENELLRRLELAQEEKNIINREKDTRLLEKLFRLEMSREEFDNYAERKPKIDSNLAGRLPSDIWIKAEKFYELSLKRDEVIAKKTIDWINAHKNLFNHEKSKPLFVAILSGGFHTTGLEEQFKKSKTSYMVLSPRMTQFENESLYEKTMLGGGSTDHSLLVKALVAQRLDLRLQAGFSGSDYGRLAQASRSELRQVRRKNRKRLEDVILEIKRRKNDKSYPELTAMQTVEDPALHLSHSVPMIINLLSDIYRTFDVEEFTIAQRLKMVLAAFDQSTFSDVHKQIKGIAAQNGIENIREKHVDLAVYERVYAEMERADRFGKVDEAILLRAAFDKFIFNLPRKGRRALEREIIIEGILKERQKEGSGKLPEFVYITDIHGAPHYGEFIAHALGVKNYKGIASVEDLEARLAAESIEIDKMNILFIGGSDYVDRGKRPLRAFRFNEWLRDKNKLVFLPGNHEDWKDGNILGMHLRVNDAIQAIIDSKKYDEAYVALHAQSLHAFVSEIALSDERKLEVESTLNQIVRSILSAAKNAEIDEAFIQDKADAIIDLGTNANHSMEWWDRDWGEHGGWSDVFFDEINEGALNQAIGKINLWLKGQNIEDIRAKLQKVEDSVVKEVLLKKIEERKLELDLVDVSQLFDGDEKVKKLKAEIKNIKARNEAIRKANATKAPSEQMPQEKVPSSFSMTSKIAQDYLNSLKELLHALSEGKYELSEVQLVNSENYRAHPVVVKSTLWDLKNFRLMYVDPLGNLYMHNIIPINKEGTDFDVEYTAKDGKTLKGLAALERMEYDIRRFGESLTNIENTAEFRKKMDAEIGQALRLLHNWYSDILGLLKPKEIERFLKKGGPKKFRYTYPSFFRPRSYEGKNGLVLVGHVETKKLGDIPWWTDNGLIHGDFAMSPGYEGLGGHVSFSFTTGVRRWSYKKSAVSLQMQIKELEAKKKKSPSNAEIEMQIQSLKEKVPDIEDMTSEGLTTDTQQALTTRDGIHNYYLKLFLEQNIQDYQGLKEGAVKRGQKGNASYYGKKEEQARKLLHKLFPSRSELRHVGKLNIKVFDRDEQIAQEVGDRIIALVERKLDALIAIPTGSSPLKVYAYLIKRYQEDNTINFSQVRFYNLDEYDGSLEKDHPLSYLFYSRKVFYEKLDKIDPNRAPKKENRNVPSIYYFREQLREEKLTISNQAREAARAFLDEYKKNNSGISPWKSEEELCELFETAILYKKKLAKDIEANGGKIDFVLLGVGGAYPLDGGGLAGGHIGFNEPGSKESDGVRVIELTPKTSKDTGFRFSNVKYRKDGAYFSHSVPLLAITMGIADFLKAEEIAVIATGEEKSIVMENAWKRDPDPLFPVTYLKRHPKVKWYLDKDAASKLPHTIAPWTINPNFNWTRQSIRQAAFNILKANAELEVSNLTAEMFVEAGVPRSTLIRFGRMKRIKKDLATYLKKNIFNSKNDHLLPRNQKIVLFSPHPDDDVITSAALLKKLAERGNEVHIVYLVAGENGVRDSDATGILSSLTKDPFYLNHTDLDLWKEAKTQVRENEASAAVRMLSPSIQTHFLRLPYYYHRGFVDKDAINETKDVNPVHRLLEAIDPQYLFFSAEQDPHGAHGLGTKVIQLAIRQMGDKAKKIKFAGYMGAYEEWPIEENGPLLVLPYGKRTWKIKKKAILRHKSQLDPLFPSFDPRPFWQRAGDRNGEVGHLLHQLGYSKGKYRAEIFKYLSYNEFLGRSEIRFNSLPTELADLDSFLGAQGRNYRSARWAAVHITDGFFLLLPGRLAKEVRKILSEDLENISPIPFVFAKGGDGASLKQTMSRAEESTVDIEIMSEAPEPKDLEAYLFGIANLLRANEGRHFQLLLTKNIDEAAAIELYIKNQYPDLKNRLLLSVLKPKQSLQSLIQQEVTNVYENAKKQGRTSAKTLFQFYAHVVISSADEMLLKQSLIPQGWLVHNDLPQTSQGVAVARVQRELLLAEKINNPGGSRAIMSALGGLFSGGNFSLIEQAFDEMLKGRSFSQSA